MRALAVEDPWLEWASKRESEAFTAEPVVLHAHERISTKALLRVAARKDVNRNLFADPQYDHQQAIEFYQHEMDWCNRLILGDSLQVMNSLAQREDLGGKVKMIYFDPPYGIKYSGNFQTKINKTGPGEKEEDLTREPEMIKAYRDTWNLGVHSYLTYLRDRLRASKDLLHEKGSIFIQIGDENLPLVALVADEVFGKKNRVQLITFKKKSSTQAGHSLADYILWYAKDKSLLDPTKLRRDRGAPESSNLYRLVELPSGERVPARTLSAEEKEKYRNYFVNDSHPVTSQDFDKNRTKPIVVEDKQVFCGPNMHWRYDVEEGMRRLERAGRLRATANSARGIAYWGDFNLGAPTNIWDYFQGELKRVYVVQTSWKVIEQCLLLSTEPGDIVLDPTGGSGTTAYVSEKWGRRWISIDTSRIAISIARKRLMTSSFQYYKLKDRERGVSGNFQYKTVAKISLRSIANNKDLDPILDRHDVLLSACLKASNQALCSVTPEVRELLKSKLRRKGRDATNADKRRWQLPEETQGFKEWSIPFDTDSDWPSDLSKAVLEYRSAWQQKMKEVNACIKERAEQTELIDNPIPNPGVLRVCGPFSIESVLPPEISEVKRRAADASTSRREEAFNASSFINRIINLIKVDGVGFLNNKRMKFAKLDVTGSGFGIIHAEGLWASEDEESRAKNNYQKVGLVCGPRYGPVTAKQVYGAVNEAAKNQFDDLVIAGFSFDATAIAAISDSPRKQNIRLHQAHISPDLTPGMERLLKEQRQSQLFNVFGKPRVDVLASDHKGEYIVRICGVDVYDPVENKITSSTAKDVAAWLLDSNYDGQAFCVVQAFFPDKKCWQDIAKSLKAMSEPDAFEKLHGHESLPFSLGEHRTIAVKVIDVRGNEVMNVRKMEA